MKTKDIENAKQAILELEARARQMRLEAHRAVCQDAVKWVALAEQKMRHANPTTIAVGTRNEAVDIADVLGKINRRLCHELGLEENYVASEDDE